MAFFGTRLAAIYPGLTEGSWGHAWGWLPLSHSPLESVLEYSAPGEDVPQFHALFLGTVTSLKPLKIRRWAEHCNSLRPSVFTGGVGGRNLK